MVADSNLLSIGQYLVNDESWRVSLLMNWPVRDFQIESFNGKHFH